MRGAAEYENDVFISYNPDDRAWAEDLLRPRLEAKKLKVIDYRDFRVGRSQLDNVQRSVETSRHTLALITPSWLDSAWRDFEALLAQTVDPTGRYRRLIPLLLKPTQLPLRLATLTFADFTGMEARNEMEMQRLLRGLLTKSRIFLSFKRGLEPDQGLALRLHKILEQEGHRVYTDEDATIGMKHRQGIGRLLDQSDYMLVLLSAGSAKDPFLLQHIEDASQRMLRNAKPRILPVRVSYNDALTGSIGQHLRELGYASWHSDEDEERVVRKLLDAISTFETLNEAPPEDKRTTTPEDLALPSKLWPNGSVIVVGFMGGDTDLQWKVARIALEWARYANLRFVFGDPSEAAIRIAFTNASSTWSLIGTDALNVPKDRPTMEFGWLTNASDEETRRVVLHEFGHALGLAHEHQLATSNIAWDKDVVYEDLQGPPNNWTSQQIDVAMFQLHRPDFYPVAKPFDPNSIMMFPLPKSWTKDDLVVGLNMELSDSDREFIHKLYP